MADVLRDPEMAKMSKYASGAAGILRNSDYRHQGVLRQPVGYRRTRGVVVKRAAVAMDGAVMTAALLCARYL